ncbi:MAG: universal stress protein [Nitrospiraceae bacterium]|nr:universal stress protein [Nitrospiraceae bacterium]
MGKYRKILVAIDGSETSAHALGESFRLATSEKSWITVVSVVPPYYGDLDMTGVGNLMALMRRPAEEAIAAAKKMAGEERVLIKTVIEEGETHERVLALAEAENCDLIIMGRRGLRRFERALVGSVTARVIGYSQRDVLVVPRGASVGWQNVLVATDGSEHSAIAIDHAIDVAKSYGGSLKILSVVDLPDELYGESPELVEDLIRKAKGYVGAAAQKAGKAGVAAETFVREAEAYQAIIDLAAEQKVDILVMGSHGRTGLRRLLMGSVTEKVIGHATCPVLVVKTWKR